MLEEDGGVKDAVTRRDGLSHFLPEGCGMMPAGFGTEIQRVQDCLHLACDSADKNGVAAFFCLYA